MRAPGGVLITNTGAITLNGDKVLGPAAPLTIRSGATLDTDAANDRSLSFGGNFTNNGTFTANASPIIISGTAAQSIGGFTTLGDVSMTKTALTATFLGNVTGGSLTINGTGGTLSLGAGLTHTFAGTWTVTDGTLNGGSSTLKLGSDGNRTGGTFTGGTGTVEWNAEGPQTIANVTYYNLLFSGSGAKSMPAGTTVANNLTIPTGDITASVGSGLNLDVETLTLGGIGRKYGTWGSSASTANFTNDVFFSATTGYLTVNTDTRVYCIWNGTGDWFVDTANWSNSVPPGDGSNVLIASGTVMLTNNTPLLDVFMITNSTLTFRNWETQLRVASDVIIRNAGTLNCIGGFTNTAMSNRVAITCSNLTIKPGGSINVNSCGYRQGYSGTDPAHGPGASGSYGGMASGPVYGTPELADLTGSGGNGRTAGSSFSGSVGGGAAWVQADGTVRVDGSISANALNSAQGGGGSGGGIHIECRTFEGIGTVSAISGASGPYHKGGGGGRIAVLFNETAQAATPKPRVTFSARGNTGGSGDGDIGTLYFPTMDLLDPSWMPHSGQLFLGSWTEWRGNTFNFTNGWLRLPAAGSVFLITNTLSIIGSSARLETRNTAVNCGDFVLNGGRLDLYVGLTGTVFECTNNFLLTNGAAMLFYASITNDTTPPYGALLSVSNTMVIATNSWLYPYSDQTNGGSPLFRVSNLLVAGGGGIDANGKGYAGGWVRGPGFGPGKGSSTYSGAGYGGAGGRNGGQPYGSSNAPVDCGSGAYLYVDVGSSYGRGGGLIRIEADQTVTIDGILNANGNNGGANAAGGNGGGSGGGIYISATRFEGTTGSLLADGADGATTYASRIGGGGGGGRIAVWSKFCTYSGTASVTNGDGYTAIPATVGTIVWGQVPIPGTLFMYQ